MPRLNHAVLAAEADASVSAALPSAKLVFSPFNHLPALALAVSGGSDSMAICCLAAEWLRQRPGCAVHVLTVDHGLRAEAAREAEQVADWCKVLGFTHLALKWQHGVIGSGVQAKAREARYALMTEWCRANAVGHLLTAHTRDDQSETVFMRQQRTASDASLAGIWAERDWNGVMVHRPLLALRREDLRDYLRRSGQPWLEDPSNENAQFERVRVRQLLAQRSDTENSALAQVAGAAAKRNTADQLAAHQFVVAQNPWREGYAEVSRVAVLALPQPVAGLVLRGLISRLGGSPVTPPELQRVLAWLAQPGTGRRTLGGCLLAKRSRQLLIGREPGRIAAMPRPVPDSGELLWDGRFLVRGPAGARVLAAVHTPHHAAGPAAAPAFVRQGWPVVVGENSEILASEAEFITCLR